MKAKVIGRHSERHTPEALAHVVDMLRAETVESLEMVSARSAELEGARRCIEMERAERAVLANELENYRVALQEHDENSRRLYAEIQRLNGIIEAMEGTKAGGCISSRIVSAGRVSFPQFSILNF